MIRSVVTAAVAAGLAFGAPIADAAPRMPIPPLAETSASGTEGLEPLLALAYTMAEDEAHAVGVPMHITSGYRSREAQQAMWEDGLRTYGGPEEARKWVLPPDESTHVSGRAVDVGPREGAAWLESTGHRWGLCRVFMNEWWHFELRVMPGRPCPPLIPDASVR